MLLDSNKLQKEGVKTFLATRLREGRKNKTQEEVARGVGISQPVLSKMEQGSRELRVSELKKLADFYRQPISFFFEAAGSLQKAGGQAPAKWSKRGSKPSTDFLPSGSPRYPVVVTPEILQTISQKIVENFQPQKVILFGSHAWGKPKPESDIDLLVVTNALSPLRPAQRRLQVKHVCQPPLVPMDVLVHTPEEIGEKSEAGDLFLAKILAEGKVLYDKSPD